MRDTQKMFERNTAVPETACKFPSQFNRCFESNEWGQLPHNFLTSQYFMDSIKENTENTFCAVLLSMLSAFHLNW